MRTRLGVFLRSRARDYFARDPVYVFHHMPKCGGTSVREALAEWFQIVCDYLPDPGVHPEAAKRYMAHPLDLSRLRGRHLLCGHFETKGAYLRDRYPEILRNPRRFRVFTFVRDPLEHRISHYYHVRNVLMRNFPERPLPTLEYWLTERGRNLFAVTFPCSGDDYTDVLDRYFFIGVTESLQDSMDRLAALLHKRPVVLPSLNVMERGEAEARITPRMRQRFRADNDLDYRIYEYALERLHGGARAGAGN